MILSEKVLKTIENKQELLPFIIWKLQNKWGAIP